MGDPIAEVRSETSRWEHLKAQYFGSEQDLAELDPQLVLDTLEGETNLFEAITDIAERVVEIEKAEIAGIDAYIKILSDKKTRKQVMAEQMRAIIFTAMTRAQITVPIKGAVCSVYFSKRPRQVQITDEADIPSEYFVNPPPKLDRKALKAALDEGKTVPGATLDNGDVSLTIRVL